MTDEYMQEKIRILMIEIGDADLSYGLTNILERIAGLLEALSERTNKG